MQLWTRLKALPGTQKVILAVVLLLAAGWVWDRFNPPRPAVSIEETEKLKQKVKELTEKDSLLVNEAASRISREQELRSTISELEKRQNNIASQMRETTSRGDANAIAAILAAQKGSPAPAQPIVIVPPGNSTTVQPGTPGTTPPSTAPSPVEIIVRDQNTLDKSTTEIDKQGTTEMRDASLIEATEKRIAAEAERTRLEMELEAEKKKKVEIAGSGGKRRDPEDQPLGVGILNTGRPFLSMDLAGGNLGPRPLGLGKIKAGVFVTKGSEGIDGGPQVNYSRKNLFIMGGYQIKEKTPVAGVGYRF